MLDKGLHSVHAWLSCHLKKHSRWIPLHELFSLHEMPLPTSPLGLKHKISLQMFLLDFPNEIAFDFRHSLFVPLSFREIINSPRVLLYAPLFADYTLACELISLVCLSAARSPGLEQCWAHER